MLRSQLVKKETTDRLLKPFAKLGLHPIGWSILSLPFAISGMLCLGRGELHYGLLLFLASGATDIVDGAVARATGKVTTLGAYIDGIIDRYVELFLIIGLMLYLSDDTVFGLHISLLFVFLTFGSLMTSFVRAYADHRGLVNDQSALNRMGGILERAERLMLLYLSIVAAMYSREAFLIVIAITALLANLTVIQRIIMTVNYGRRDAV